MTSVQREIGETEGAPLAVPVRAVGAFLVGLVLCTLPFSLARDPVREMPRFGDVPQVVKDQGIPSAAVVPVPLPRERAAQELRLFFVGASMTFGLPYEPAGRSSYAAFLEVGLRKAWDRGDVHVRPDAYPALDSPQLADMAERCLGWGASHLVLVVGTNEFVNRIASGRELRPSSLLAGVRRHGAATESLWRDAGSRMQAWFPLPAPAGNGFLASLDAAGPGRPSVGGLPVGTADRELLMERLERALVRTVRAAKARSVPLLFAIAPHGHSIAPPRLSALGTEHLAVDELVAYLLRTQDPLQMPKVMALLRRYPERADLHHVRALLELRLGDRASAAANFTKALDLDLAPLHRTSRVVATIRRVGREHGVRVLDLNQAFADEHGIVPTAPFLDYSHLTFEGQQSLARWLRDELSGSFLPELPQDRRAAFDEAVADYAKGAATAESRRLAVARLAFNNGNYYRMLGNFHVAECFLERAVRSAAEVEVTAAQKAFLAEAREALRRTREALRR